MADLRYKQILSMSKNYAGFVFNGLEAQFVKDPTLKLLFEKTSSQSFKMESIWNPNCYQIKKSYEKAITGSCIWNKNDAVIRFQAIGKGSAECERSIASPSSRDDVIKRLNRGQKIKSIQVSENPFGKYQETIMAWQKEIVSRYGIKNLYFSLPLEEYKRSLVFLKDFVPASTYDRLIEVLDEHFTFLKNKITNTLKTDLHFLTLLTINPELTIEESYIWPYTGNLDIELGIEEFTEFKIPYEAYKINPKLPPIVFGVYDIEYDPYYKSKQSKFRDILCI